MTSELTIQRMIRFSGRRGRDPMTGPIPGSMISSKSGSKSGSMTGPVLGSILGALIGVLIVVGAPGHASADSDSGAGETLTVEAPGEADAEDEKARTRAIDRAFVAAVEQVVEERVDEDIRRQHRRDLRRKVIRRARRFVKSFKVLEEVERDDRLHVKVRARIDLDKLDEGLREIGIEVTEGAASRDPAGNDSTGSTGGPRPRVMVLLEVSADGEARQTFGSDPGDGGAAGQALVRALELAGFEIVAPPGGDVLGSDEDRDSPAKGLPLSDLAAGEMARRAGAGGVFVVGIASKPAGMIRGTRLVGATSRARVRLLDVTGEGEGLVVAAGKQGVGFADSAEAAMETSAIAAVSRLVDGIAARVTEYWPASVQVGGAVIIAVKGYRAWPSVAAVIKHLQKTRGVDRVWPVSLGNRRVSLAVETTLEQRRLISAIRKANVPSARGISVKTRGERELEIRIREDAGVEAGE